IDNEVKEVLHNNYELTPIVASTILKHSKTPTDRIVLQCVQLLQRITYNCRILYPNSMIDDLLTFLMTHIQGTENQLTLPCLGLMANLCKNNVSIQAHIKSMDSIKSVYKALIQYLSHRNLTMIVFALSVITSLCLNEDLGNKLFQAKNVNQTFQLLFNILIQGEDLTTIQYVADLFVFLLKSPKIQQSMLVFEDLSGGIQEVLKLLTRNSEPESICKTFELLLAFCKSSGIRCTVCHTLMSSPLVQNCESVPQHPMQLPGITQPFYAVLHWTRQTHATHDKAPLLALDFLKEIYEEMLDSGLTSQLSPRIDLVLPTLSEKLHPPTESDDKTIKHQCVKSVKIIDIIQDILLLLSDIQIILCDLHQPMTIHIVYMSDQKATSRTGYM
ncbi:protein CIP2A-like, partial [Saccoglossus kowalevskii]|uniref:Protein CIP2A-like n=1 Tax=Saccoglossus kowalevskii TaxID=10224 RepID=A0ABM0GVI9_SACKO